MVILLDNLFLITLSFNLDKSDTITIYYDENIFYDVSYEVSPKGSGQIRANDIFIRDTIVKVTYPFAESVNLEAIATNGWRFSHWDKQTNTLNPSEDNSNVNFTIESSDNIRANFKEMFQVYVPNSFTPANDDNLHNTFDVSIYSIEGVKYEFEVFNRFGESLFYSNDESISWDGSYKNGSQVPSGVYIYMLTVESNMTGKKIHKKGSITLLR